MSAEEQPFDRNTQVQVGTTQKTQNTNILAKISFIISKVSKIILLKEQSSVKLSANRAPRNSPSRTAISIHRRLPGLKDCLIFRGGGGEGGVSRQVFTAESRIRSQESPREIYCRQWHWDRFLSAYFGLPHFTNAPYSSPSKLTFCSYQKNKGTKPSTLSKEAMLLQKSGSIGNTGISICYTRMKCNVISLQAWTGSEGS